VQAIFGCNPCREAANGAGAAVVSVIVRSLRVGLLVAPGIGTVGGTPGCIFPFCLAGQQVGVIPNSGIYLEHETITDNPPPVG
jgi:hypothetical protein